MLTAELIDRAQELGNRATRLIPETSHQEFREVLLELERLRQSEPLAVGNVLRDSFIDEILANFRS